MPKSPSVAASILAKLVTGSKGVESISPEDEQIAINVTAVAYAGDYLISHRCS